VDRPVFVIRRFVRDPQDKSTAMQFHHRLFSVLLMKCIVARAGIYQIVFFGGFFFGPGWLTF
jgi:hypothetical protein